MIQTLHNYRQPENLVGLRVTSQTMIGRIGLDPVYHIVRDDDLEAIVTTGSGPEVLADRNQGDAWDVYLTPLWDRIRIDVDQGHGWFRNLWSEVQTAMADVAREESEDLEWHRRRAVTAKQREEFERMYRMGLSSRGVQS